MKLQQTYGSIHPISYTIGKSTLHVVPSIHNSIFFHDAVYEVLQQHYIDNILIEFPHELAAEYRQCIARLPIPTILHHGLPKQTTLPLQQQAFVIHPGDSVHWAAYLGRILHVPVTFIDSLTTDPPSMYLPITPAELSFINWDILWQQLNLRQHLHSYHLQRSLHMAEQIKSALEDAQEILLVVGIAHWPVIHTYLSQQLTQLQPALPEALVQQILPFIAHAQLRHSKAHVWKFADIHPHSLHLIIDDLPAIITHYLDQFFDVVYYDPVQPLLEQLPYDYTSGILQIFFTAEQRYSKLFDDNISPASYTRMLQYLRNLMSLTQTISPSLYMLLTVAKGIADDDYAFEVYRAAIAYRYLPNEQQQLDEQIKFIPDEQQGNIIKFAFKRRFKRPILSKTELHDNEFDKYEDLDPIPEELYPGQWEDIWEKYSPFSTVSYPPEDVYIENYFHFLRKKALQAILKEKATTEEFQTTMLDGIDWKETIRHFHEHKIYVQNVPKSRVGIGALIVQFLENPTEEYSHHSILFAEHDQESDISIVSTSPGDIIVGPGISRMKLAAVISVYPPTGKIAHVPYGSDPLKTKLIFAAMKMATTNIIVLVSAKAPNAQQKYFAHTNGYKLVHIPMQQLTKASLHRLRTFHLLAHRSLRDIARYYLGY